MAEHVTVSCPGCQRALSVPPQAVGRKGRCPQCGHTFTIAAGGPAADPAAASAYQAPADPMAALAAAAPATQTAYSYTAPPGVQTVATITPQATQHLRGTRPWVLFMSILMFIGAGFMVIGGLGAIAMGGMRGMFNGPMAVVIGLAYIVMAAICGVMAYLLLAYAGAIKRFAFSQRSHDLEAALGAQKSFWKFVGILTIVVISLYLVVILIAMVVGATSAMRF